MDTPKQWRVWSVLLASFAFPLLTASNAKAQDDQARSDQVQSDRGDQDPPGRVARVKYAQGSVSFRPAGEDDWVTAELNRTMVTGDDLWADEDSRAEAHIGSTAIRLGAKTGITFLQVDDHTTQIRLAQGSLIMSVRHVDDDDTYEVDTPNLAFALLQPGEYRVDVSADGNQTIATVWHGRGRATGGGSSYTVVANQSATFTGSDQLEYELGQIPAEDDFDRWSFDRGEQEDHADSANYVSREVTGYEDLDEYGEWSYVAGYGPCWRPTAVAVGWAPYRFGHWVWLRFYGWTWVEDEPWGFAPFHYGRWAFVSNGWFWVPGPVLVRPVWAPAFVAFVGGGAGFQFSFGAGVGWFPLAPGEVFVPGYRVSPTYVNRVNITNTTVNVTKITNVYNTVVVNSTNVNRINYANQHVNGGVTVVSREVFVNARPVAQSAVRVQPKELEAAPVTHVVRVEPVRASVMGTAHPSPLKPPAAVISRKVVVQNPPPAPARSFAQRQAQAGGHLNEPGNQEPGVRAEPLAGRTAPGEGAKPQQSRDGFRPFTRPEQERPATGNEERRNGPPEERNRRPPENRNEGPVGSTQREDMRPAPQETHPLARPAPPVRERNPQQERDEEQKFRNWQQQRPASPPPRHEEKPRPPEQKQDKSPKSK